MKSNYNFYPFTKRGERDEFELVLAKDNKAVVKAGKSRLEYGAPYNGYVVLPNTDIPKKWQGKYDADGLQYLQVHGGLTYCQKEGDYTVFGFDCGHLHDKDDIMLYDTNYIMELTEQMEQQILEYAKRYKEWQKADEEGKLNILDEIRKTVKYDTGLSMGALLRLFFASLESN